MLVIFIVGKKHEKMTLLSVLFLSASRNKTVVVLHDDDENDNDDNSQHNFLSVC